jgi:hypothetical protein
MRPVTAAAVRVAQPFDHLANRNLPLIRRRADALLGDATTPFPYVSTNAG